MSNCKYCGNESYGRPFCPECGKKYFGFKEPLKIQSANSKQAKQVTQTKQNNKIFTQTQKQEKIEIIINQQNDDYFNTNELKKYNIINNPDLPKASHQEARIYQCKNGNKVRSKSERDISDFLTEHEIEHAYEKPLKINNDSYQYIHPDFYIPGIITHTGRIVKNIYIEHLGGPKNKDPDTIEKYWNAVKFKIYHYKLMKLTVLFTYEEDMINPNNSLKHKLLNIKEKQINYFKP